MRKPHLSACEAETVIHWSRGEDTVWLWTAAAGEARKWRRAGYVVRQEGVGWRCEGPVGCVRVRKVKDGELVRRVGRVVEVTKGEVT